MFWCVCKGQLQNALPTAVLSLRIWNKDLVCSQVNTIFAITSEKLRDLHQLDRAASQHLPGLCWPKLILPYFSGDSNYLGVRLH